MATKATRACRLTSLGVGLAAGAVPLILYLRTAAPTVWGVDSAELTTGAYLLGIVHPPGAPGYLLLGHLFTWLPWGDVGYRLNLFSVCCGALSMAIVYHVMRRLTGDALLALATSWFVSVTYYVWVTAVAAELYAVYGCIVIGLIALALRWRADADARVFYAICLTAGFGASVHLSLVLLLPGLALLVLSPPSPALRRPRLLLAGALCGLLGASTYAYLPLRYLSDLPLNPARDYWHVDLASWQGFWWMVSGRAFERHFYGTSLGALPAELVKFGYQLWSNFMGLGAVLGLIGLASDLGQRPWVHGALLLMLLGHVAFFLPYGAGDKEMMFLPAYLIWGLWIGFGIGALFRSLETLTGSRHNAALGPSMLMTMAVLTAALNFRYLDLSDDWSARRRGEELLDSLDPNAVFFGAWGDLRLVEYLQFVEKQRRDIKLVDLVFDRPAERRQRVLQSVNSGQPVYVAKVYLATCADLDTSHAECKYSERCDCYRIHSAVP